MQPSCKQQAMGPAWCPTPGTNLCVLYEIILIVIAILVAVGLYIYALQSYANAVSTPCTHAYAAATFAVAAAAVAAAAATYCFYCVSVYVYGYHHYGSNDADDVFRDDGCELQLRSLGFFGFCWPALIEQSCTKMALTTNR